jgi:hypothetical protein
MMNWKEDGRQRSDYFSCVESTSKLVKSPWSVGHVSVVHLLWIDFFKIMIQLLRHKVNLGSTLTLE